MSFKALSTVYSRDSTYAMHIAMHVSSVDMLIVLIVYKMWGRKGVIFYTGIFDFAAGEGMPDIGILLLGINKRSEFSLRLGTFRAQTGTIVHSRNFLVLLRP